MAQAGPAHRLFAATYAKLGRHDEAQRWAAALLEFTPDFSVRRRRKRRVRDHYVTALRLEGLPD